MIYQVTFGNLICAKFTRSTARAKK